MHVTEEQMEEAGLTPDVRDYCAHHLIEYLKCRKEKFPWFSRCVHEKHVWDECQFNE